MAWVRIHDGAMSHPKIIGMFDWHDPFHVWVWGLSQSQMHLTDGFVAAVAVPRIGRKAAEDLVCRGLWEAIEGGWRIHDFLDWNDDRETIRKRRSQAQTRMERFRKRVTNAVGNASHSTPLHKEPPVVPLVGGRRRKKALTWPERTCPHEPRCTSFKACRDRKLADGKAAS